MRVHVFGCVSSPSCASFALRRTATDNQDHFDEETVETVRKNFYVDDCLKSVQSEQDALRLTGQLRGLLAKGGFRLTKWLSNSRRVIESVPTSEIAGSVKNLDLVHLLVERASPWAYSGTYSQMSFASKSQLRTDLRSEGESSLL